VEGTPAGAVPKQAVELRPSFVEVGVAGPAEDRRRDATGLELVVRGGYRLRVGVGFDAATLRRVLDVLEEGR